MQFSETPEGGRRRYALTLGKVPPEERHWRTLEELIARHQAEAERLAS